MSPFALSSFIDSKTAKLSSFINSDSKTEQLFSGMKTQRNVASSTWEASEYIILLSRFLLRTNPIRLEAVEYNFHFKYQVTLDKSNILSSRMCKSVPFLSFYIS